MTRVGAYSSELISTSVAETLSALRTVALFAERAARADVPRALDIVARAAGDNSPLPGDEIVERPTGPREDDC